MVLARDTMQAAHLVLKAGLHRRALSEAYFAMHQAGRAALAAKEIEVRTHKGLIFRLREQFSEEMDPALLTAAARLQALRERSDYDADVEITPEQAADAVREAETFIEYVSSWLARQT